MEYKDKKVLVVGFGRSGRAAAMYLLGRGARVVVCDTKDRSAFEKEIGAIDAWRRECADRGTISYKFSSNSPSLFVESDLIVLSPGVPLYTDGVLAARERGVQVVSELEMGLPELQGSIIAITGTNGKSTTTVLAGELLKRAGKSVWVGGNIGRPLVGGMEEARDRNFVVLEVSSYQLETTPSLRPKIAVWLNATPDHLDRYSSFDEYVAAKTLLGRNQKATDWLIFNADDPIVTLKVKDFSSEKIPFSISRKLSRGASFEGRLLKIKGVYENAADNSVDTSVSRLNGLHNMENMAAASLIAVICGLTGNDIERGLAAFQGLPHRLEFVRDVRGVKYFDDSKGTNVGAVIRSLQSFDSPVVLIAGGQDKNTGYKGLEGIVREKVRLILAIGEAASKIKSELGGVVDVRICGSMEEAVRKASLESEPGNVVLLSPACASFDMFRDYAHRGEVFRECVNRLE